MKHSYDWESKDLDWETVKVLEICLPYMVDNVLVSSEDVYNEDGFGVQAVHYTVSFETDEPHMTNEIERLFWLVVNRIKLMKNLRHTIHG